MDSRRSFTPAETLTYNLDSMHRAPECDVIGCQREALLARKFFVDFEGFWTWLCSFHHAKLGGRVDA